MVRRMLDGGAAAVARCLPRSSVGTVVAAAAAACLGYGVTAFVQGRHEAVGPEKEGVALAPRNAPSADRSPHHVPPPPRVTLDVEPTDDGGIVNAFLELPDGVRRATANRIETVGGSRPAAGVWLTGSIEPAPAAPPVAD